jgi:glutamine phosphoribosylpyrophosphate amidotransferase
MCGVIGFTTKNMKKTDVDIIKRLFVETQIRGKHATGISWVEDNKIKTEKYPIPAKEFIKKFDFSNIEKFIGTSFTMIGHIRYSTSDILYNQPMADEEFAIAHNGVITQKEPDEWEKIFGYKCQTKNDSELLFHFLKEQGVKKGLSIIDEKFPGSSFSVVVIENGSLFNFRNGLRPQWKCTDDEKTIVSSTKNILYRCNLDGEKVIPIEEESTFRFMEKPECKQI